MKNFLDLNNLNFENKDSLNNLIKSTSEVSDCSIINILEENQSTLWISNEEFPQEIILNLSREYFKEYPKKITAIGLYCWHAYPTNPKLVEIQISKNNDNNFLSFGNFDLCLKPGKQLLQLVVPHLIHLLSEKAHNPLKHISLISGILFSQSVHLSEVLLSK